MSEHIVVASERGEVVMHVHRRGQSPVTMTMRPEMAYRLIAELTAAAVRAERAVQPKEAA